MRGFSLEAHISSGGHNGQFQTRALLTSRVRSLFSSK